MTERTKEQRRLERAHELAKYALDEVSEAVNEAFQAGDEIRGHHLQETEAVLRSAVARLAAWIGADA